MRPILKREEIPRWEAWGFLIFLFIFQVFLYRLVSLSQANLFPSLSFNLLALIAKILAYTIILVFCMVRFGRINLVELIPNRKDIVVLVLALLIEFWAFGIFVGPGGLNSTLHDSIRDFSVFHYWFAVFIIVGLVPLTEEAVFRRYFLEIQRQHYSTGIAVFLTALIATLFHFEGAILPLLGHFLQQGILSVVYVKSRLGVSVLVHAFINGLVLFLSR